MCTRNVLFGVFDFGELTNQVTVVNPLVREPDFDLSDNSRMSNLTRRTAADSRVAVLARIRAEHNQYCTRHSRRAGS
eukprot:437059-Rhodomonas_salina.3